MKYIFITLIISLLTISCKKQDVSEILNESQTNTQSATVPCDAGILINGCFENDSLNFDFPTVLNFDKFQFKHKKRDFIRLVNGAGSQSFLLVSEQTFVPDTYNIEVRVPKSGLSFALDFGIDAFGSYFPIFGYPFSAQIDTSSFVQFMNYTAIIDPSYAGLDVHFLLSASGSYGQGLVSKIDYIKITKQ